MGDIAFDADEARPAARVARRAAETLRGQAGARSGAVEAALDDFEGSYAERFRSAAVIEAEDRARLAGEELRPSRGPDRTAFRSDRVRRRRRDRKRGADDGGST